MQLKHLVLLLTIACFLASMILTLRQHGVGPLTQLFRAGGLLGFGLLTYIKLGKTTAFWFYIAAAIALAMMALLSGPLCFGACNV